MPKNKSKLSVYFGLMTLGSRTRKSEEVFVLVLTGGISRLVNGIAVGIIASRHLVHDRTNETVTDITVYLAKRLIVSDHLPKHVISRVQQIRQPLEVRRDVGHLLNEVVVVHDMKVVVEPHLKKLLKNFEEVLFTAAGAFEVPVRSVIELVHRFPR
jgi:hypothetical protein